MRFRYHPQPIGETQCNSLHFTIHLPRSILQLWLAISDHRRNLQSDCHGRQRLRFCYHPQPIGETQCNCIHFAVHLPRPILQLWLTIFDHRRNLQSDGYSRQRLRFGHHPQPLGETQCNSNHFAVHMPRPILQLWLAVFDYRRNLQSHHHSSQRLRFGYHAQPLGETQRNSLFLGVHLPRSILQLWLAISDHRRNLQSDCHGRQRLRFCYHPQPIGETQCNCIHFAVHLPRPILQLWLAILDYRRNL